MTAESIFSRLHACLSEREEAVVNAWWDCVCEDEKFNSNASITRDEFKNNIGATIKALGQYLQDSAFCSETAQELAEHGNHRWRQSFDLTNFLRDWGHLHTIFISEFRRFFGDAEATGAEESEALARLALFVMEAMTISAGEYDRLRRSEAASLFRDLKRLREHDQLMVQHRTRALREYAHDMRGSLSAIAGAGSALSRHVSGDQLIKLTEMLDEGVEAIAQMLESLLELSQLEAGIEKPEVKKVQFQTIVDDLVRLLHPMAEQKSLDFRVEGDSQLVVESDPDMLRRILQNLLVNAIEYTERGWVTLRWKLEKHDRWSIWVEDTGNGIQRKSGAIIAQEADGGPLSQEAAEALEEGADADAWMGEGIGLTIVKRLSEMLEIAIEVDSEQGKGTRFRLTAPCGYDRWKESAENKRPE